MPKIKITNIQCIKPEESEDHPFQPGDELRLDVRIDDEKYFTVAAWKGTRFVTGKKMSINREWEFLDMAEFRLVELDGYTSDESLGTGIVKASTSGPGGILRFTESGADYAIEYRITA